MIAVIGIDVDDVCLNLVDNWLSKYNKDFNDNLEKNAITDWNIHNFVKEEAQKKFYEYIQDGELFLESEPVQNSLEVISWIKAKHYRVVYVTANDPANCKFEWLLQHKFLNKIDDLVVAYDKNLIKTDILIDDRFENICDRSGGWLFSQPWNKKYNFKNRVNDWIDVKNKIEKGIIRL
jgi:5'(3')-deoxyribonucleotidase